MKMKTLWLLILPACCGEVAFGYLLRRRVLQFATGPSMICALFALTARG